jgi:ElaA protein
VLALHDRPVGEIDPVVLYRILRLRSEVFVVEQACVYLDPDGRDLEPAARQLWLEDERGEVVATARVLADGGAHRIGRIATAPHQRGAGLAARLVEHFLASYPGPWRLDAQTQLTSWYEGFGFVVDGPEYDDDGILHVPMVRPEVPT